MEIMACQLGCIVATLLVVTSRLNAEMEREIFVVVIIILMTIIGETIFCMRGYLSFIQQKPHEKLGD